MAYGGTVELVDGIKPKNNGTWPLVNAHDVYVDDENRLDDALSGIDDKVDEALDNAVRVDKAQTFTDEQKLQARSNISAVELASDLTETGKAADAKVVGDEIDSLKTALNDTVTDNTKNTVGDQIIPITGYNQFVSLDNSIADVSTPTQNNNYNCSILRCSENDTFTINAYAGQPRTYGFVAEDGTVLLKSGRGYTATDLVVKAPENSYWLVINDSTKKGISYIGIVIKQRLSDLNDKFTAIRSDVEELSDDEDNLEIELATLKKLVNQEDKKNYALVNEYQLWDKFNVVNNAYIQSNGTLVQNSDWVYLSLQVTEGITYYFATPDPTTAIGVKVGSAGYVALINSDNTYYDESPTAHQWVNTIVIPSGVNKMIVSIPKTRMYDSEEFSIIAYGSPTNTSANKWSPRYKNFIQEYKGSTYKISCIGDSLTAGAGGSGTTYPSVLGNNDEKLEVNTFGFPSEDSLYIAYATGGMRLYVDPFTIPESNSANNAPTIIIRQDNGNTLVMDHVASDSLCRIGGVLGKLKYEDGVNKFQRLVNGNQQVLTRREPLYQCFELKHVGDITIIWAGTNDAAISSITESLFYHINNIINLLPHKKYLVLGIMQNIKFSNITSIITYFRRHYGSHFINIRQYLLDYGLSDAGITPTEQDTTDIANGTIPSSLRSDETHLNANGYTVVGNYLYKIIKDYGWLNE